MVTYKPLSTISYNTRPYLQVTLDSLIDQDIISFYAYIPHQGEGTDKAHIHVYIEPTQQIDTKSKWWTTLFLEPCVDSDLPLNVKIWKKSKYQDWYLYSKHDRTYLTAKQLKKEIYNYDDAFFCTSSTTEFLERNSEIDTFDLLTPMEKMIYCDDQGMDWRQAMIKCRVSYGAMHSFYSVWTSLMDSHVQDHIDRGSDIPYDITANHNWVRKYQFDADTATCLIYYQNKKTGEIYTPKKEEKNGIQG